MLLLLLAVSFYSVVNRLAVRYPSHGTTCLSCNNKTNEYDEISLTVLRISQNLEYAKTQNEIENTTVMLGYSLFLHNIYIWIQLSANELI